MKLNCGPSEHYIENVIWPAKFAKLEKVISENKRNPKWERTFALFPVRVAENDCRWLEFVERAPEYIMNCDYHYFNSNLYIYSEPKIAIKKYFYRAITK